MPLREQPIKGEGRCRPSVWGHSSCSGLDCRSEQTKGETHLSKRSESHFHKDFQGESTATSRAISLRRIIRTQFAFRGTNPNQSDADLSTKWSEETMKVLEAGGAAGVALQRQIQLFAAVTLLELKVGKKPKPEQLAPFLQGIMGLDGAHAITREDWSALNAARGKMSALIADPKWSMVHGGHIAMSCLTLLSLYDISLLNFSYSG